MVRRLLVVLLGYAMVALSFCFVCETPAYNPPKERVEVVKENTVSRSFKEGEKIVKRVASDDVVQKQNIIQDTLMASNPRLPTSIAKEYAKHVVSAANYFKVDPFLVAAVMIKESTANFMSASSSSCGLMQIHWEVHKEWLKVKFGIKSKRDIYDPKTNIYAGAMLLSGYLTKEGSVEGALARYLGATSREYAGFVIAKQRTMLRKYKQLVER